MTDSRSIAGLLGPTLIAIGISEAVNLPTLTDPPDLSELQGLLAEKLAGLEVGEIMQTTEQTYFAARTAL